MSAGLEMGTAVLRAMSKPLKWWVVIAEWEQGIRIRLGKNSTLLSPGIHFRIPWLDRIYVQSDRLRTMTNSGITCRSRDNKTVVFGLAMHFAIANVKQLYMTLDDPEQTIRAYAIDQALKFIEVSNAADITTGALEKAVTFCDDRVAGWGLRDLSFTVTTMAVVRAYRLLSHEHESSSGLADLSYGERK